VTGRLTLPRRGEGNSEVTGQIRFRDYMVGYNSVQGEVDERFLLTSIEAQFLMKKLFRALARRSHESLSRDGEDGRATGQPQGVGSEAYLNGTSQGPAPEDARKVGQICCRSR